MLLSKKSSLLDTLSIEILNKIEDLVLVCDKQLTPLEANKKFLEKFGFDTIEQFFEYHSSIRELFFWEKLGYLQQEEWFSYIKNTKDYHVKIKDTKRVSDFHLNLYTSQKESVYILIFTDVTEVYRSMETIKEFERLKSDFLANISHEFRTPMNGIMGFLELFYYTDLSKKQKEYLSLINRSAKVLLANIEALFDYSQLQSGKLKLNPKHTDIVSIVEKVVKNYAPLVFEGKKHFYTFIDPSLPQEVILDERKIRQVMQALIDNAIKFTTADQSIIVDVRLIEQKSNGSCSIRFSVKDNGVGIDTVKLPKLLEPFRSEGKADKRLGLGLALASGLVSLFGSKLEISSTLSKGSSFSFVIHTEATASEKFPKQTNKTAVVIELDKKQKNYANTIALYLQSFGYKVMKVHDATSVKKATDIAVVVTDAKTSPQEVATLKQNASTVLLFAQRGVEFSKEMMAQFDSVVYEPLLPSKLYDLFVKGINLNLFTQQNLLKKTKKSLHILVVEDNLINQKLLKTILEEKGIVVYIANDGIEAVEMANKREYDVIFMDIDLPRKNGIEATQDIKRYSKYNKNTPIIAQTAMAMDGDKERLLAQGLDGYIPKPLQRESLNLLLESLNVN